MSLRDNLRDAARALLGVSAYQSAEGYGPKIDDEQVRQTRRALNGQIQPLPITRIRWFLKDLEDARYAADTGNLQPAAQLYRAMRQDGVFAGLTSARGAGLVRLPRKFYGDQDVAAALQSNNGSRSVFDEMYPPSEISATAVDGFMLGISVGEHVPVQERDYPVYVRLEPEFLQYRWNENRWYFLSIAGALPITPGDGRWMLHIPGPRMSPWNHGLWPACGESYINKTHAKLHRANYSAKLANPARAATAPIGASENERRGFIRRLIAWGTNAVFELPIGWEVKLIESNGRGYEVFQQEIDTSDKEYMIAITGQEVTTTGGSGFSNSDVQRAIRQDLTQADAEALAYTINTQGLPQYIVTHYGGAALTTKWCGVQWDTAIPKEMKDQADTLQKVAQAIAELAQVLAGSGADLDTNALCTRFGIPLSTNGTQADGTALVNPPPKLDANAAVPSPEAARAVRELGYTPIGAK